LVAQSAGTAVCLTKSEVKVQICDLSRAHADYRSRLLASGIVIHASLRRGKSDVWFPALKWMAAVKL